MTLNDLKKQYDALSPDNYKALLKSIKSAAGDNSVNQLSLIGFLDDILEDRQADFRRIGLSNDELSEGDRSLLVFLGKIAGLGMVLSHKTNSRSGLRNKTLQFLAYASIAVKTKIDFVGLFLKALSYRIKDPGLKIETLLSSDSLDVPCFNLQNNIVFDKQSAEPFQWELKGAVNCSGGSLVLCTANGQESTSPCFSVFDGLVSFAGRNTRGEKLKESDRDEADALAVFANTFVAAQNSYKRTTYQKEYEVGETVDIRLEFDGDAILCKTIGEAKSVSGRVADEELIKGVWTRHLIPYLFEEDCIENARIIKKEKNGFVFSIKDAYRAFAKEQADRHFIADTVFEAKVLEYWEKMSGGRLSWMTPYGFGGVSSVPDGWNENPKEYYYLTVSNIQGAYVNLAPPRNDVDAVVAHFPRTEENDVLKDFVVSEDEIEISEPAVDSTETPEPMRLLATIIKSEAFKNSGLAAYKMMLASSFLFNSVKDDEMLEKLRSEAFFLRQTLCFAQGKDISESSTQPEMSGERVAVLKLLSLWDKDNEESVKAYLALPVDSLPGKIAALLAGLSLAGRFKDEIKADRETVRKRICELLGVAEAFRRNETAVKGKYGSIENKNTEFKSSYVFRNDGKGADLDYQGRGQVFEAVCGFLNADGGTVYIGVRDDGNPILSKDSGLNADIAWLSTNYSTVNLSRINRLGHPVCKVETIDNYVQFLNSEKELYFKEQFLGNITIESTEDVDAIRISVAPAEYSLAYLYTDKSHTDGQAFVRDGGRTIPMTPAMKQQRLAKLKHVNKIVGFAVTIQEAIDNHEKLVFRGYSSGNSGEKADRMVVPISLFYNDENAYCYDIASKKDKQFRLHRISSIEETHEKYTLPYHNPVSVDVFRWLSAGEKSYHIKLRMDVGAKNYLLEEYSCAETLPETALYEERRNKWILDTRVNGLDAVRRFYLGLADKIEILDTEDSDALKANIAEYLRSNFTPQMRGQE